MASGNTIYIKNMVCNRCIMAVKDILDRQGLAYEKVDLGVVTLQQSLSRLEKEALKTNLEEYGFELLDDKRMQLVELIRVSVIELIHYSDNQKINLSEYLTRKCLHDYSFLSKLFSEMTGTTLEKYYISQKIERAKELLVYDELTVSEIAYKLHYSSVAHFSTQFRAVTGFTPTQFKQLKEHKLRPLDKI